MNREFQFSEEIKVNYDKNHSQENIVLCLHCKRTKENPLPCIGKCVGDTEY